MADTKISALTAASAAAGANEIPINEAGASKKLTVTQLATFVAPTLITGASGTVGTTLGLPTLQVLTSNNSDIPTTSVVTQLTGTTVGTGWWLVEYFVIWQSNVTTTGITFIVDHTGTAANSQWTREDMMGSTTALATVGISNQALASANSGAGTLPSNYSARNDAATLGPNTGVDTINVNQYSRISGLTLVTASGNLLLQANSEIASTITRVCAGTTARYTKLS
jgi:hypothetical protein